MGKVNTKKGDDTFGIYKFRYGNNDTSFLLQTKKDITDYKKRDIEIEITKNKTEKVRVSSIKLVTEDPVIIELFKESDLINKRKLFMTQIIR